MKKNSVTNLFENETVSVKGRAVSAVQKNSAKSRPNK